MPKSKRNKQVSLTKKKKNALELKKHLVQEVQSCVDKYANIFVFSVNNMRNSKLKEVREKWKDSRFFYGKNKVMALALGRCVEEDYKPNLHKISKRLQGQCGLLFSNRGKDDILRWFNSFSESDYARSGNIAEYNVDLPEGPLPQFPHSLEPYLRQLGLPTTLKKGIVCLIKDFEVCKEGDVLTPETAKILKLLGHEMAEFKINLDSMWSNDGAFEELSSSMIIGKSNEEMQVDDNSDEEEKIKTEQEDKLSNGQAKPVDSDEESDEENEDNGLEIREKKSGPVEKPYMEGNEIKNEGDSITETNLIEKVESSLIVETPKEDTEDDILIGGEGDVEMQVDEADDNVSSKKATQKDKIVAAAADDKSLLMDDTSILVESKKPQVKTRGCKKLQEEPTDVEKVSADDEEEEVEISNSKRKTPVSKVKDLAKKICVSDVSSPEEKSPLIRTLRNRTVKVERKKKK